MIIPTTFLSKKENTYCVINNGMPATEYISKQEAIEIISKETSDIKIWDSEKGKFEGK